VTQIGGNGVHDVVECLQNDKDIKVTRGIHPDKWEKELGKHITVELPGPYLDTYHLYGWFIPDKNRWIVRSVYRGTPLKV
jgi:hypothetical protein